MLLWPGTLHLSSYHLLHSLALQSEEAVVCKRVQVINSVYDERDEVAALNDFCIESMGYELEELVVVSTRTEYGRLLVISFECAFSKFLRLPELQDVLAHLQLFNKLHRHLFLDVVPLVHELQNVIELLALNELIFK